MRHLRRDHAAAEPAGLRALLPVARAAGDLRRRRGERRGQPRALRVRELLRDARARQRRSATARSARCAPRACRTDFVQRGGDRASASTSPRPARASAPSTVVYDRAGASVAAHQARRDSLGRGVRGRGVVPRDRHHAGARPGGGRRDARGRSTPRGRPARAISLDLNYRAKLWSTERAQEVMRPLASMVDVIIANEEDIQACLGLEVHGADVDRRAPRRRRLSRRGGAGGAGVRREAGRHHAARELLGEPQRLERGAV